MKINPLNIPASGTWPRDCELISLSDYKGFQINYHRNENDTYWNIQCEGVVAYKVTSEEFALTTYLLDLPVEGAFFEILNSPWIHEFGQEKANVLNKCKHYIFRFYDETIEIIAQKFIFNQLKDKPC